jgi:hypothetical protein
MQRYFPDPDPDFQRFAEKKGEKPGGVGGKYRRGKREIKN